ncbi:MAG: hypothetical protein IKO85_00930 [Bacteroidaceae bacterium]|nr:hypothetical protein [Bacteroidaceae bacterium]
MEKSENRYVVWVSVAPYVCRYLVDNFGVRDSNVQNLIDIRSDAALMAFFTPRLQKSSHTYDRRLQQRGTTPYRTARVAIEISASRFSRSGWALSPTDEAALARMLELRCQGILLAFLQAHYMISGDASESIRAFYRTFHQSEDTWPYDSIRKIWNRNVPRSQKVTLRTRLEAEITEKILLQLSSFGTISAQGLNKYQNEED